MKTMLQRLLLAVTVLLLIGCHFVSASADGQNSGETVTYLANWTEVFELNEYQNGYFEITKYSGSSAKLQVWASGHYKTETYWSDTLNMFLTRGNAKYYDKIGDSAFSGSNIIEITLDNSSYTYRWDKIGNYAFKNCKNLRRVTIPSSVNEIGVGVFDGCNLNLLTVTVGPYSCAERYCRSNKIKYEYEDGVYNLYSSEYSHYDQNIEDFVYIAREMIDDYYFSGTNLAGVVLINRPGSDYVWKKIGNYAFQNCRKLKEITIPSTVTSIGVGIFDGCNKNLLTVTVDQGSVAEQYCKDNGVRYVYAEK